METETKLDSALSLAERDKLESLERLIQNFTYQVTPFAPSTQNPPSLKGIDIYGVSLPHSGIMGGDLLVYVDFKRDYNLKARIAAAKAAIVPERDDDPKAKIVERLRSIRSQTGILLADVSGHLLTDAALSTALYVAFTSGIFSELDDFGEITTRLFENLNKSIYMQLGSSKMTTLLYGEISEQGRFRFLSAGHLPPLIYSQQFEKFVKIEEDRLHSFPPIGSMPTDTDIDKPETPGKRWQSPLGYKKRYSVNELNLMGHGDILLLYTDGVTEQRRGDDYYAETRLEAAMREFKHLPARDLAAALGEDLLNFGSQDDDISFVIIKKS